jgi:hypothetical protein
MVYLPNIPVGSDRPSLSRGQIQTNFSELDTQYGSDHVAFSGSTLNGSHNKVTLNQLALDQSTLANQLSVYAKSLTTNSVAQPEIYVRQQSNAATPILLTRGNPNPNNGEGGCYGGLQIRCGSTTLNSQNQSFTFSTKFPTACLGVVTTNSNSGNKDAQINVSAYTATTFNGFAVGGNASLPVNFSYIAFGY